MVASTNYSGEPGGTGRDHRCARNPNHWLHPAIRPPSEASTLMHTRNIKPPFKDFSGESISEVLLSKICMLV